MLGSVERSVAAGFVQALAARDGVAVLAGVDGLRERGLSAAGALEEIATLLQQMAVAQAVPNALDDDDPDTPEATRLAALMEADETQLLYSIAVHGRAELQLLNDEYAALTMVLLRFLAFPPSGTAPTLEPGARSTPVARTPALPVSAAPVQPPRANAEPPPWVDAVPPDDTSAAAPPVTTQAPTSTPGAARAPTLQTTELGDRWNALVQQMAQRSLVAALVRELAMQSQWIDESRSEQGSVWRLRVERESLRTGALRDKLQAAVSAVHGSPVALELVDGATSDTPALRDAAARARAQQQAEQTMTTDPVVRELMSQFKTARLVPGSIKPVQRNPSP
jgi:DNA polymerase-3 subunit gamma/tau